MSAQGFEPALRFIRVDGVSLYPWWRRSKHHGHAAFWVADGSNHMNDATAVESLDELIGEVFTKGRSVWLRPETFSDGSGLYRVGEQALVAWDASPEWVSRVAPAIAASGISFPRIARHTLPTSKDLLSALEAKLATMETTERTALVRQRVGQALYREAQHILWEGRCAVTDTGLKPILRASHAKPWSKCASPEEQLDPYNGFLLSPHVDALFDAGFLSFDSTGAAVWSECLPDAERERLGLPKNLRLRWLDPRHQPYLDHHREVELRQRSASPRESDA